MMCIVFQRRVVLRAQTDSLINTLYEHLSFPLKVAGVHMQVCGRRVFYDAVPQRRQVNCNIPSGFNFNFNKLIAITVRSPLPASSRVSKALRPAHKYPLLFINIIKVIYGAWAEDTRKMFSSLVFCEDVECNPSGAKTWENGWKTTMSTSTQNGKFSLRGHNSYISHISKRFIWQICLPLSKSGLLQQFWDLISLQLLNFWISSSAWRKDLSIGFEWFTFRTETFFISWLGNVFWAGGSAKTPANSFKYHSTWGFFNNHEGQTFFILQGLE